MFRKCPPPIVTGRAEIGWDDEHRAWTGEVSFFFISLIREVFRENFKQIRPQWTRFQMIGYSINEYTREGFQTMGNGSVHRETELTEMIQSENEEGFWSETKFWLLTFQDNMQDPRVVRPKGESNVNKHWTIAGRGIYPTALTTIVISSRWYSPENTNSLQGA